MKVCGNVHNIEHIEQKEQLFTTIFLSVYNGCKTLFFQFYLFAQVLISCIKERGKTFECVAKCSRVCSEVVGSKED